MKTFFVLSLLLAFASADNSPSMELEGRITNAAIARRGQFPYQAGLMSISRYSLSWCGGSIISERYILTAAHCVWEVDGIVAYLGAFNITNNERGQQRIYSSKANIVIHADFDNDALQNDIALIRLPVRIEFNEFIQFIHLPKKSEKHRSYEGELIVATGWGRVSDNTNDASDVLRFIEVPVSTHAKCNSAYDGKITEQMICTESPHRKSACRGDSGGPLAYRDGNKNVVIGISSFGQFYCEEGDPSVYTRVTAYLDWIEKFSGVVNEG